MKYSACLLLFLCIQSCKQKHHDQHGRFQEWQRDTAALMVDQGYSNKNLGIITIERAQKAGFFEVDKMTGRQMTPPVTHEELDSLQALN